MAESFDILETEYGAEISVRDIEAADQFDDFLTESQDIGGYLRTIDNGMIFGLGKSFTRAQAEALVAQFLRGRQPREDEEP
jgi:hypothetical protein